MEILLNPGPVNISKRVRDAMLKPDLCHREIEFTALQDNIRNNILDVYKLDPGLWAAVLLTGSGTSAMEAMLTSMLPENGKVLIIENGVYGERLSRIAEIYEINFETVHYDWGEGPDPGDIEQSLNEEFTHIAVIHHETTTGRLNDIGPLAEICKSNDIQILLDGVSSFAAEEIKFTDWNITACGATANKCLHGIPGASFVICRRDALKSGVRTQRTLYLDLKTYLGQQDEGGTPFTQSVQSFYALDEALLEHREEGGWQARHKHYWDKMDHARDGLEKLGIRALLPRDRCSCVLNSFYLPDNMDYRTLHDGLKKRGFVIYAGQGGLVKSIFRISLMGVITDDDINRFLTAVEEIISN